MSSPYELLEIYDLKGNLQGLERRCDFYDRIKKEYKETGKITSQVKTVKILILTSNGRIYIQKRSDQKQENAGLYDKTIGGHVQAGYTWEMAVTQECHEELGFPVVVLSSKDFKIASTATDLEIIGIAHELECVNSFKSIRKIPGGEIKQPQMCSFYIGYYDGSIKFRDGESTGVEVFSPNELVEKLHKYPELFTDDLQYIVKKYHKYIKSINK